jgi:hypothetical protein
MILTAHSVEEIDVHIESIRANAGFARRALQALPDDPVEALAAIKFDPVGCHPLERRALNLVEQINQTFTYLVALKAARMLLGWHPEGQGYRLAPGAHAPTGTLDIESIVPGLVGAETFAAVRPENNRKLAGDLRKLAERPETHRYVFFMSPLFPKTERLAEREKEGVQVWSISMNE